MRKDVALALLGLQDDELDEVRINQAYRAAIQMNHPDRYATNEQLRKHAEEQCKLINEAREVLLLQSWEEDGAKFRGNTRVAQSCDGESTDSTRTNPAKNSKQRSEAVQVSLTPLLDIWRTSAKLSVLGVLVFLAMYFLEDLVPQFMVSVASLLRFAYIIFQFVYALTIYPSLFGLKPKLKSKSLVSFWNCAVGGPVFGPLWNSNLTKRHKGISNIAFAVLVGLLAMLWLLMFGFAISLLMAKY